VLLWVIQDFYRAGLNQRHRKIGLLFKLSDPAKTVKRFFFTLRPRNA
jgi:hypothetical protein